MTILTLRALAGCSAVALVLAACSDSNPVAPIPPAPVSILSALSCVADVPTQTLQCRRQSPDSEANLVILGGQDQYVKLTSFDNSFDGGTGIFQSSITVQNLIQQAIGTTDGSTVTGVRVFFHSGPSTTGGAGEVTVANADGTDAFTNVGQPYFLYNEILETNELSAARPWQFQLDPAVTSFAFVVYVAGDVQNGALQPLDKVWDGSDGVQWETAANWEDGVVPDSTSAVSIPSTRIVTPASYPTLGADARVMHLRAGVGSTLSLGGFRLTAGGNVDAPGSISGGTVRMTGATALLSGNVAALEVTGSTRVQAATETSGPVSVTGTLTVRDEPLNISIP